jgi:hypothetical protein
VSLGHEALQADTRLRMLMPTEKCAQLRNAVKGEDIQ